MNLFLIMTVIVLWLIILLFLGGFVGIIIASILMKKVGRRIILITVNVPFVSSWLLIIGSQHLIVCILGRLLAGKNFLKIYFYNKHKHSSFRNFNWNCLHRGTNLSIWNRWFCNARCISDIISIIFTIGKYNFNFCYLSNCNL